MKDKQSTSNVPIITRLKTQDIDELAEWARGWEQEHTQLQKGAFEWESCIIEIDGFQFIEELYGSLILCRGKTPPETFALGIPQLHGGESLYGYLKILRLHQVRRALKSANSRTSKVTELATSCGFWHMGQFSQDYKQMFGESPSITLKKNLGNFSGFQV